MRENRIRSILIFTGSMFLIAFALIPFIWMIWISLASRYDFLVTGNVQYTLNNYIEVLTNPSIHFSSYFWNTMLIAVVTSVVVTVFSSMAGYAVSRLRFPGRVTLPILILAMSMFPQIALIGYLYNVFASIGLINTHLSLILPYIAWTIPIALWINMSYFSQIPVDLDKAALVDGASRAKILYKVILPIALPGIFSAFLLVFIACFNEFLFAIMLTNTPDAMTLPVGIAMFTGTMGQTPWGLVMATSALASIPLVILTLIFQRYIVQGLVGGAVKG